MTMRTRAEHTFLPVRAALVGEQSESSANILLLVSHDTASLREVEPWPVHIATADLHVAWSSPITPVCY